jgi:hypothetical protein
MKIRISRGTARKNSTTTVAGRLTHAWSDSRPAAKTAPNSRDSTAASANARRVLNSACTSRSWMFLYWIQSHIRGSNWPVATNRKSTNATTASSRVVPITPRRRLRRLARGPGVS